MSVLLSVKVYLTTAADDILIFFFVCIFQLDFYPKNSFIVSQEVVFTYCGSFGSHREPSPDCDLHLVME